MAASNVVPFTWGEIALTETVQINGVPHATRRALGEWLEYPDPQEAVRRLLNRNVYIEAHSVPVRLTGTDGKNYETKVYHPIGFLLVVMESGQPKAQRMKQAVAEFVWLYAGPPTLTEKERLELMKHRRNLLNDLQKTRDPFVMRGLLTDLRDVSLRAGLAVPDTKWLPAGVDQLGLGV